jgi:hypothetical protein
MPKIQQQELINSKDERLAGRSVNQNNRGYHSINLNQAQGAAVGSNR